jgi:hypothetical protein
MSWIKVRTNLSDDPSVWEIADALNMDAFAVIGRLHSMWAWFDGQATADDPWVYVTSTAMDRRLACAGWCAAVAAAGWLLIDGNRLGIPNFDRHNGETAKERALASKRQKKKRSRKDRDKSVTREEKRRVDIHTPNGVCKARTRFVKPTLEELTAYCQERGNSVNPQRFLDHYEANGWRIGGKSPMKDWRAAVRNWESRENGQPARKEQFSGIQEWLNGGSENDAK